LLQFHAVRPTLTGLEQHLATIVHTIQTLAPQVVVMDPISNLTTIGTLPESRGMLTRLIDYCKKQQITALFTSLVMEEETETSAVGVSSLMDTWLLLRMFEHNGERNRGLFIIKIARDGAFKPDT
jgi:circadian clock protein KaiC